MPTLNERDIQTALDQWAEHIVAGASEDFLGLVGLISHGDVLARRLIDALEAKGISAQYGAIDITLYRDDIDLRPERPALRSSYLPFSTDGMHLILVDDVSTDVPLELNFSASWIADIGNCPFIRTTWLSDWRTRRVMYVST